MKKLLLFAVVALMMCACVNETKNETIVNPTTETMDFLELTQQRYSERFFDSTKMVEQEKLDRILEAGRQAPTAANMIPAMMLPLGYPSANSAPSPMHFKRKPMEAFVTEL